MKLVVAIICFALRCEGLRLQKPESDSSPVKEASVCVVGDVHFGEAEETDIQFKQVVERIAKKKCAAVVLLGDLSGNGKLQELKAVKDKLGKLSGKRILAIPGNHDIHDPKHRSSSLVLNKLNEFITTFGEDHHVLELLETTIVVANCEVLVADKEKFPELQEHRESSWAKLEESLRTASEKKRNIVLITHRPLIKLKWEEPSNTWRNWPVEERNRLLAMLPSSSTTHVLAGHVHKYTSLRYEASGRKIEQETIAGTQPWEGPASFAEITVHHDGRVRTKMIPVSNVASPISSASAAPFFSR